MSWETPRHQTVTSLVHRCISRPEVLSRRPATALSDQYSVGVLLYYLVTGDHPVRGRTLAAVRDAHTRGERVSLAERVPDVPQRLTEIVERATAPDPAKRFDSISDLGHALSNFVDSASTTIPAGDVVPPARRRTPSWVAWSLVVGAIVAAGALLQLRAVQPVTRSAPHSHCCLPRRRESPQLARRVR